MTSLDLLDGETDDGCDALAVVTDDEWHAAHRALPPMRDVVTHEQVTDYDYLWAPGISADQLELPAPVREALSRPPFRDPADPQPSRSRVAASDDVARMRRIIARMTRAGLVVVEQSGWESRGRSGTFAPRLVFEHHDASSVKSGLWGSLGYIMSGSPIAPLSQFQVSRDGRWAVIAAGRCNHAGLGGPILGIGQDSGNAGAYGVEVANDGVSEPYSDALHRSLDVGLACILAELGADATYLLCHGEYAAADLDTDTRRARTRKQDTRHNMHTFRRPRVAAVLREDDDVLNDADKAWIAEQLAKIAQGAAGATWAYPLPNHQGGPDAKAPAGSILAASYRDSGTIKADAGAIKRRDVAGEVVGSKPFGHLMAAQERIDRVAGDMKAVPGILAGLAADLARLGGAGLTDEDRAALAQDVAQRIERVQVIVSSPESATPSAE